MESEIIVDVGSCGTRIALLEDGKLAELFIEKTSDESIVGNIYRGKVTDVLPGMQAAFVDIGMDKNAFLYVDDAVPLGEPVDCEKPVKTVHSDLKIEYLLKAGQEITVQVIKDPIGTKGPRVTTNISLPGRYLVLVPDSGYIGVSQKIEDGSERLRLRNLLMDIRPEGMGLIARTAAEGRDKSDFERDLQYLLELWERIRRQEVKGKVPRIMYRDLGLIYKIVRDLFTHNVKKLVINNREEYEKVLEFIQMISPSLKLRVECYEKEYGLFEYYQVESDIARALSRKIWLKSGGYLVFDQTEALTVVDVNTGKYTGKKDLEDTVLKTNIEAAVEIARQLRLRDIGGIIIIDFIDMKKTEHRQLVISELKNALKRDRTKTAVVGLTNLGLVEMTRKKVHKSLALSMKALCPMCGGTGRVLPDETAAMLRF